MKYLSALVLLAGCATSGELSAVDELVLSATTGGEESLVGSDDTLSPAAFPAEERPDPFRVCDAEGGFADLFDRYDADADGRLDAPEEEDVFAARGEREAGHERMVMAQWAMLVTVYDLDGDGAIGTSERATLLEDFTTRCATIQEMLLADYDADGDGELSESEQDTARAALEAEMEGRGPPPEGGPDGEHSGGPPPEGELGGAPPVPPPLMDEFDTDGDDALSATELEALRATMRARIQSGEPLCGL